jgi:hypothetical protein
VIHVGDLHWDAKPGRPAYPPNRPSRRTPPVPALRDRIASAQIEVRLAKTGAKNAGHRTRRYALARLEVAQLSLRRLLSELRKLGRVRASSRESAPHDGDPPGPPRPGPEGERPRFPEDRIGGRG